MNKFDLTQHLYEQKEFSENTFGPGIRTEGVTDHIRKELEEILKNPSDLMEWVDVMLLAFDGAWRSGHSPEEIVDTIKLKFEKNKNRKWPDWRTSDPNKAIEHDRCGE